MEHDKAEHPEDPVRLADDESELPPEDQPGVPGAEGGSHSPAKDKLPSTPAQDGSAVGDTDQHSDA